MADTVFHLMTVVRVSHSSSGVLSTTGFAENDRRGLELWTAAFGSRRSGAATERMEVINIYQSTTSSADLYTEKAVSGQCMKDISGSKI